MSWVGDNSMKNIDLGFTFALTVSLLCLFVNLYNHHYGDLSKRADLLLDVIIIIKSEIWVIIHCLALVHEIMVCAACLAKFFIMYLVDRIKCCKPDICTMQRNIKQWDGIQCNLTQNQRSMHIFYYMRVYTNTWNSTRWWCGHIKLELAQ